MGEHVRFHTRVGRRLSRMAAGRGLLAADEGPAGTLSSLREWVREHEDHCGARWISAPLPMAWQPPRRPPRTVCDEAAGAFEAALAHFKTLSRTSSDSLDVAILPGARLVGTDGLVITHDGLLAGETAWDEEKLEASGILEQRRLPRARFVPGASASLISQWCGAYYHWITDALPRLAVLDAAGCGDVELIVPEELALWQRRSLDLLGRAEGLTPYAGYLRAETLIWPRPTAFPGHTPRWACEWLRGRLVGAAPPGRRRLYLTRRDESRSVTNEDEVWALLEPMGFTIVDPGKLALDEQIGLFAQAAFIVAPHGGALTNVVFSAYASVVELFEPGYVNPCFYALADACGHAYWYCLGQPARGGGIEVNVAQLARTLAAAGIED